MATFFAVLKLIGADRILLARIADAFGALKRSVDEDILRRHDKAILHSLDKRILDDAGIASQEEATKSESCRNELRVLRTLFSWTRFAK
jgi:hypothetical protein